MKALLVGGTGPTGPHLLEGLLSRGYDVAMFHSGRHEPPCLPEVEHIHGDPFSVEGIDAALAGRSFDAVVATYGRVRLLGHALAGRCMQFVSVGGIPVYGGFLQPDLHQPQGMPILAGEETERVPAEDPPGAMYGVAAIRRTEDALFQLQNKGAFRLTIFRYPMIYGPRNPHAWEWSAVKRVIDGRSWMMIPDAGLAIHSRAGARNAAHGVLLALDRPEVATGKAYNVADDKQFSLRQWIEMIIDAMNAEIELISFPGELPNPGWGLMPFRYRCSTHALVDTFRIRSQLGYSDIVRPLDGLKETVQWLVANAEEAATNPHTIDTFDYAAEDRLLAEFRDATRRLHVAGSTFDALPEMPVPQTAEGHQAEGDAL